MAGPTLLLETADGLEVVTLEDGATLTGVIDMLRVAPGDSVRVTYSREMAGVKMAEVLAVAPEAYTSPEFWINIGELKQLLDSESGSAAVTLVDARASERFEAGHIPGALSLPADSSEAMAAGLPADKSATLVFYSDGPRCGLGQQGVRMALSLGYTSVRSLRGGLPVWVPAGGYLVVDAAHVVRELTRGTLPFQVVDVREEGEPGQTLPGAARVGLEMMPRQWFLGEPWLPPFLFVGENSDDGRPVEAARKVVAWRRTDLQRSGLPVYVLEGGVAAWQAAGNRTVPLGDAPSSFVHTTDEAAGEIPLAEFRNLWQSQGSPETLLLDVRDPRNAAEEWVTHIPLEDLHERVDELPKDREIVAYCDFGNRSAIAYLVLQRLGYRTRYLATSPEASH
jgi:rhodanese-related sulfurtransferase